jgi:transcriptional regulator with XRE-family HTH domain
MNDELKALLEEAYNRGASKSDLDQIVNRYNQKKKEPSEASDSTSLEEPSASDTSAEVPAPFGEVPKFEGTKDKEPPKTRQQVIEEQRAAQAQKFADIGSYVGQSIAEGVVSANTYLNRAAEILLLGNNTNYFSSNSAKLLEPLNQEKERLQSEYVGKETLGEGFTETFQRDPVTGAKRIAFEFGRQVPQMYALGAIGRSTMLAEGATAAGLRTGSILAPRTKLVKKIAEDAAPMIPLGMSSAGQAYLDAAEKNPEDDFIDAVTNLAVATYKGTGEIASELMFRTSVDDLIRGGFRKGLVSDIAKSTRPTLQAVKQVGKDVATEGFQEGLEELAVEISSNAMDALVFGEDMFSKSNVYGMADAFILGSAIGSPITLLSKGPSAIGTANNINKRRNISEEINDLYDVHQDPNTSASEKAVVKGQIINKLAELKQVENNLASFYEEFSEEDRNNVISLNQELSMAQLIYPELKNEQSKDALQEKVKQIYSEKTKIESKYDPNIKVYEYDSQKEAGIPSPIAEGEAAIEAQPIEGAGKETTPAGRVLQAREKLILESIGMDATLQAVERGEEVEQSDAEAAQERILQLIDDVDKSDIPADAKQAYIQTLEDKFDELEYYDNKTITTTEQVTEEVPVGTPRAGSRTVVEPEVRLGKLRLFEKLNNVEVAVGTEAEGQTSVMETQEDGSIDVVTYDKASGQEVGRQARVADNILGLEYVESIFDADGNLTGVVMRPKTPKGQDISSVRLSVLNRPELAIDIAIDARKKQIGDVPEVIWLQEYETVTRDVTTKEKVPAKKRPSGKAESETESVVEPVKEAEVEEDVVEVAQVVPRANNKNNLTEAVADNAIAQAERLAKRLGLNVKIIPHNSRKAFDEAMNQLSKNGASDAAREGGRILFDRNEIHINLEDMTLSDPFHEVFHAAFVNRFAKGSQAQRTKSAVEFKNGILKVLRSGSAQDKQLADEVEQFVNDGDYNPSEKAEEFMAQTAGIIATNAQRISKSTMDKLMQWLNNFISKIAPSMKVTTRGEFIDFMNSFSGALFADTDSSVQTTESTVNLTSTNDLLDSSSRGDFTISYFEDTDQYKKFVDDGLVVNNFSLNQIAGQPVATHQPDNFMVGDVKLGDKVVVEGDGGVYFVLKFGEVWASGKPSSASGIAKAINWSRENSTDGKGRMLLARGTTPKLISSTKGVKGGMQILEEMVDRNLIPRKDFRASLIRVGKKYGIDFSGNDSMTSIKNDIEQKFMKPSDSTFAKRGLFFEDLISDISSTSTTSKENIDGIRKFLGSTKRISFSKEGITSAIAELMTERMLIDLPSSHAYAVIEVDNDVKVEKSKKHDSYPYSIVQVDGKRPTLYLLKDRPKAVPSLLTRDGERATNAKVGFAQMGYGRAIVDPALLAASATQESQVNKSYDELLESSSKQQVQLGMQQAQINYDIDTQLAESSSWQQRERTPMEKYNDLIRIKIQDKLYRVIKLQEDIEYSTGKPVGLDQDFRNAETLMHGKAANDLNESMDRAEKVAENVKKSGTTLEAFDDLLYALHAQERNRNIRVQRTNIAESITDLRKKSKLKPSEVAEMAGIDIETYRELEAGTAKKGITSEELNSILSVYGITPNKFYTDYSRENAGSGMTDIEAQTILSTYGLDPVNPDVKSLKPALRDAVNGVYAIIADSRERMLDYGLETLDTVVAFESMYKNYVPLRGFEGEDSASEIIGGGRSLEVRGREKRSLGRKSKADSPFLNAVAQNQSTIVRARKNEVAQRLYRLAEANPNDQIWKIVDPSVNKEYKKKATSKGIKDVAKTISDYILDDRNFAVRINGEYKFIQFTDPRMAEMLRGANVTKAEFITKYLGQFNRMLSSFITTYDPEFVLRNFSRDIQVAVINAISEQEIEGGLLKGKNVTTKVVKSVPGSIKAIFNMSKKGASPSNEFERYYKEFIEDGAKTEWFYSKSVDELRKDVDKLISDKKDTRFGSTKVKAAEDFSKNFIERINSSVENGVRLAAYMESRRAGLSRDKAAELAKNLTVNFNKSGEWGTVANSLYLFFNASVQGTSRLIRTLKPQFKKNDDGTRSLQVTTAQKIAVSMFIAGSLMSLLNEALSDDDEDEKSFYSKIPDFEKERNIIIMLPNGKDYFKIPLPYGLNVFYVAGNAMADAGQGLKSVGETATNILQAAIGSFSPINFPSSEDFSSWIMKFLTPTVGQIPLSLSLNEDYFGRTIYNENFPTDPTPKPESELGRKGATPQSSWIAKELNKLTGGSEFRSGMVDINPDKIDFFLETLSGGAGRFALRSTSAIGNLVTGNWDQMESNDIPFARVFYGQPRKFVDLQSYFDKRIEVNQYMEEVKSNNLNSKDSSIVRSMYSVSKSVDKALRNIKKMEKNAEQIKDEDAKRNRLLELERMRYTQLAIFQKAYEQYKIDEL